MMLEALMSRWRMPASWMAVRAVATCLMIEAASGSVDASLSAYSGGQGFAGQELHRQEGESALRVLAVKDVVDGAKIRMDDLASKQHLALETSFA